MHVEVVVRNKEVSTKEKSVFYVVAMRQSGIWYTLCTDNKVYWCFSKPAKTYKRLECAKKAANRLFRHFINDGVWVFKYSKNDTLGSDSYNEWKYIEDRIIYKLEE